MNGQVFSAKKGALIGPSNVFKAILFNFRKDDRFSTAVRRLASVAARSKSVVLHSTKMWRPSFKDTAAKSSTDWQVWLLPGTRCQGLMYHALG